MPLLTLMLLVANWRNDLKMTETLAHGYSSGALSMSFPINANMTGFIWFSKKEIVLVLKVKVASGLEGLRISTIV